MVRVAADVLDLAAKDNLTTIDVIHRLYDEERASRLQRAVDRRIRDARFPELNTVDGFDFDFDAVRKRLRASPRPRFPRVLTMLVGTRRDRAIRDLHPILERVDVTHTYRTPVSYDDSGHGLDQRGLARSVVSEKTDDLTRCEMKVDLTQHLDRAGSAPVGFRKWSDIDGGGHLHVEGWTMALAGHARFGSLTTAVPNAATAKKRR